MLAQVIKVRSTHFNDKSYILLLNNTSLLIHCTAHRYRDNHYLYLRFSLTLYHKNRMYRYLLFLNFLQVPLRNHVHPERRFCDSMFQLYFLLYFLSHLLLHFLVHLVVHLVVYQLIYQLVYQLVYQHRLIQVLLYNTYLLYKCYLYSL